MILTEIILKTSLSLFILTGTALGIYLLAVKISERIKKRKEDKYRNIYYNATTKKLHVEIVFSPGEYQVLERKNRKRYYIYLPGTNHKVDDLISVEFSPGHIFYKT